jgi:hypothetical protein
VTQPLNLSSAFLVVAKSAFSNSTCTATEWHHLAHPEDGEPFSVHLTYQYGDTGQYAYGKRERMRQAGIWHSDPESYYTDGKFLVIPDVGAQVQFDGPETVVGLGC